MRHLLDVTRVISFHMHVAKSCWSDMVLTMCYFVNCMPSSVLGGQIPHHLLLPDRPLYTLPPHAFGRTCYVHVPIVLNSEDSVKSLPTNQSQSHNGDGMIMQFIVYTLGSHVP